MRKDKRPEYKKQRADLEKIQKDTNCNGIKVKAELWQTTYNRNAAVNYANGWWNGRNPEFADFKNLGGDCTNYASQIMQAGGYQNDSGFYSERTDKRYYGQIGHNTYPNENSSKYFYTSPSFRGVNENKSYIKNRWYTSDYYYFKNWKANGSAYSGYSSLWEDMFHGGRVTTGDVVYADWENDGNWDHSMIITDWYLTNNYGWMPRFTYHDTNTTARTFDQLRAWYPNANFVTMKLDNK